MKYTCLNESTIEKIENSIPKILMKHKVPGVSLSIIEGNREGFCKGFGVKNSLTNEHIINNTIFEGASLTKPVVAYATLKLHDMRSLDLDTPLGEYLPQAYLPEEPLCESITARHVLSHTCGFPNWRGKNSLKVEFTPGEKFSYSGEGFVYLQKVIEHITQQPLDEYIKDNVFTPLKMEDSALIWINRYDKQAAYPHDENGEQKELYKALKPNAAWSLYTTPQDYIKFVLNIIDNTNENLCLIEETRLSMIRPQVKVNEFISWGLGWGIENNENTIWHWGDNGEFKAFVFFSPKDKVGIIIMTNGFNGLSVCRDIINEVFECDYIAFSKYLNV